jgi:hypothetical protein
MMSNVMGIMLALVTEVIFLAGMVIAIPSMVRYLRIRAM